MFGTGYFQTPEAPQTNDNLDKSGVPHSSACGAGITSQLQTSSAVCEPLLGAQWETGGAESKAVKAEALVSSHGGRVCKWPPCPALERTLPLASKQQSKTRLL